MKVEYTNENIVLEWSVQNVFFFSKSLSLQHINRHVGQKVIGKYIIVSNIRSACEIRKQHDVIIRIESPYNISDRQLYATF